MGMTEVVSSPNQEDWLKIDIKIDYKQPQVFPINSDIFQLVNSQHHDIPEWYLF